MKLTIENISKQYKKGAVALDGISTELTEGVYGILGPNGSGKTTLMRILADILTPTYGKVLLNGADKTVLGERYRELVGYLPQEMGLYKNFTVYKFLMYIAALKGMKRKTASEKVYRLLESVNLAGDARSKCGSLSGGMKRRLGIAQALLNDPKILILDEPTSGLDPKERIRFRNMISDIAVDRIVMYSTHIVSDVELIADEIILLKDGRILRKDTEGKLLGDMTGKVWMIKVPYAEYKGYEKAADESLIANILKRPDHVEMRVVSDVIPFTGAEQCEPVLEDMYLYYFRESSLNCSGEAV